MNLNFKPVTKDNQKDIEALQLFPFQIGFIETIEECLIESEEYKQWKPVGIYYGEALIGFAMYGYFEDTNYKGRLWLDRLLIDKRFQGKGYGKEAVTKLIKRLYNEYGENKIYLSVYESNKAAISLYEKAGFYFNGEYDTKGEKVMEYSFL